jgi:peptidoglycan/LPS O-acetylase OafA/YrhL
MQPATPLDDGPVDACSVHIPEGTRQRLAYVDALRGWAVLGVILGHCALFLPPASPTAYRLLLVGGQGVQLFFITSAFTLCRSASARSGERRPTVNFLIRRVFRIVPMFYLAAGFYLWLWGWRDAPMFTPGGPSVSWGEIVATLTFANGFGPYWHNRVVPGGWSVVVEMYFYLLFPLLFRWVRSLEGAWMFALLTYGVGVTLSVGLVYLTGDSRDADAWGVLAARWLPAELPVFALGFVLFQWLGKSGSGDGEHSVPRGRLLVATALVLLIVSAFSQSPLFPPYLVASVGFFCFAAGVALHPATLLAHRAIQLLGKISFSAYLVHFAFLLPVRAVVVAHLAGASPALLLLVYLVVTVGLTAAVSAATYRLVELPGISLGKRLIERLEHRPAPMTSIAQTW